MDIKKIQKRIDKLAQKSMMDNGIEETLATYIETTLKLFSVVNTTTGANGANHEIKVGDKALVLKMEVMEEEDKIIKINEEKEVE